MYIKKGRPTVERVSVSCCACGKALTMRVTDLARRRVIDGQRRVFCSRVCSYKIARKPRRGINKTCEVCGQEFYCSQYFASRQRFCSIACHNVAQTKPHVFRECEVCSKPMELKPSTAATQAGRFCSKRCNGIGVTKRLAGFDHNGRPAIIDWWGYVTVWEPEHPRANHGRVRYHRVVVEKAIGRYLTADEQIDHINRVKTDNELENLQILSASAHGTKTNADVARDIAELAEYRKRFGPLKPIAA